nr:hypothetical protein [Vibrio furnissii]
MSFVVNLVCGRLVYAAFAP